MIPREILKKIRQIELRTNRLVTGFAPGARLCEPQHSRLSENVKNSELVRSCAAAAGRAPALRSLQPSPQFGRIPSTMPHSNHLNLGTSFVDGEVNGVRPAVNTCLAAFETSFGKPKRLGGNRGHHLVHFKKEPDAKSFRLALIPGNRFAEFKCGFDIVDEPKAHFLYLSNVSSRNSSHGIPRPEFLSASSARRSSSAACSGVRSASNSSRSFSKTSRCSSNGSLWNCSRTWVALMASKLTTVDRFARA